MSLGFRIHVGAGKSRQNPYFVCIAWRRMNCCQATHQVQVDVMILLHIGF